MSRDIQQRLKNALQCDLKLSKAHLEQTIRLAQAAYGGRRKLGYSSTFEMLTSQLRFVARPVWLLQGLAMIALCAFLCVAKASEQFASELPAFVSVSAVFVAMTVLPVYGRSRRYGMRELESTTRISHSRLILAKLCAVGLGDLVCLSAITLSALSKMTAPAHTVLTFILLPFLICCTASLLVMNRVKEEYGVYVAAGLCIAVGALCRTMAARFQPLLTQLSTGLTAAICAALAIALLLECCRLMKQIPSSDLQEALIF